LYNFALIRRYSIRIKGEEILETAGAKLILPNHPSYIDAQLIAVVISMHRAIVPVVSEKFLKIPVISYFLRKWNAIAVSDLASGKRDPDVLKKILAQVKEALDRDESVVIYPAGHISQTPIEKIPNKQSAYLVVSVLPDNARVIGVRISGLWGSMWSVAWRGDRPNFVFTFLKGIFYFFANFIFFSPKRPVAFEFVDITEDAKLKAKSDRSSFNSYLEEFYNINGPEKASYIKHIFYFPQSKRECPII
jgi:1-acyl-sn-glycerol-3-phosphate acyltransferase